MIFLMNSDGSFIVFIMKSNLNDMITTIHIIAPKHNIKIHVISPLQNPKQINYLFMRNNVIKFDIVEGNKKCN